jgi:hypothetical protein
VKDETVSAFIEMLGQMIVGPEQFADEPVIMSPA